MHKFFHNLFGTRINRSSYFVGVLITIDIFLIVNVFILPNLIKYFPNQIFIILLLIVISYILQGAFLTSLDVRRWHDCTGENWLTLSRFNPNRGGNISWTTGEKIINKFGEPPKPGVDLKKIFGF